jgi:dienelactone hydrolase
MEENLDIPYIDFIVMSGRALLYPVYKGTYERHDPRLEFTDANPSRTYAEFVGQWVKDARRSMDYLESRPEVDSHRIGYYGLSWGARMGNLVLAVEDRLRVAVLLGGGFPNAQPLPEVAETNYASRVKIPVLMLNGAYDAVFPLETNQKPMFDLLGSREKEHAVFESGHILTGYRNQMIQRTLDWLDRHLGSVR